MGHKQQAHKIESAVFSQFVMTEALTMTLPSEDLSSRFIKILHKISFKFFLIIITALINFLSTMGHFAGSTPFKSTWKFDRHRVSHCAAILLAIIMTGYSIFSELPNKLEVVKVSMGIGIFTQTIAKAVLVIIKGETFETLRDDIEKMYKTMEKLDNKRRMVLTKCVYRCSILFKILFVVDASATFIFLVYPVLALIFMEKLTLMFPFYCPFIDRHTAAGFIVNAAIHGILLVYTLLFHNSFDSIFALIVLQVVTKVEFLKMDFAEVQDFVLTTQLKLPSEQMLMKKKLRDLIIAYKAVDAYIEGIGDFFLMPCFVTVTTSVFSICVALVLIMIVKWELAYGLTWALSGQLFIYFVYGTIIYHQVQIVNDCIWNFPWYLLNIPNQKSYQLMMLKAQRPINLEIKFIGRLEMETFKDVKKKYLSRAIKFTCRLCRYVESFTRTTRSAAV